MNKMSGSRAGRGGSDSWVRRFSVDETGRHPGGFTLYKITSVLFPLASPEAVSVVSVWKRYSDVCRLQRNMRTLHAALHLKGDVPAFKQSSYFRRFDEEVIAERRATTKKLLEFIADHRLLFTSAEFVNFLQSGYDAPTCETSGGGVIEAIRSALHLPSEEAPPLEYPSDDEAPAAPAVLTPVKLTEESKDFTRSEPQATEPETSRDDDTQLSISEIQVFEAVDVEFKSSPQQLNVSDSFESLSSWGSGHSNFYDELDQVDSFMDTSSMSKKPHTFMNNSSVSKKRDTFVDASSVSKTKNVLPDLISFPSEASTSRTFEDYHTMDKDTSNNNSAASLMNPSETTSVSSIGDSSLNEHSADWKRSTSRQSARSVARSGDERASRTEDSYVFEAGYMLSLGARCEDLGDYRRAFHCYKSGIEKMLLGVQSDTDQNRRSIIKEKTSKYLAYAEAIYTNHLLSQEVTTELERERGREEGAGAALPACMLRHSAEELAQYRVLCVPARGAGACMSLLHKERQTCLAMKVIQKIPNNRKEFDDFFSQPADDTKSPVLPTNVPYMVRLRSYVDTPDLIFLILDYAPGGKLLDYIANYVQSLPSTPAREVNLENVFIEPAKRKNSDIKDNASTILDKMDVEDRFNTETTKMDVEEAEDGPESRTKTDLNDSDISVNDLVINSQRLLLNVDSVLSDEAGECEDVDGGRDSSVRERSAVSSLSRVKNTHVLEILKKEEAQVKQLRLAHGAPARDALPPATVRTWGAELLTALEHLHNAGVICRDLNADNLLLGERGQLLLTYCVGYREREVTLARLARDSLHREPSLYVAPELYDACCDQPEALTCDWWSFGALMYELICRVPLSHHHRSVFTSHTILQLPEGLALDVESFLTQLLRFSPAERLGAGGVHEIKSHPYFRSVDWHEVLLAWRPPD